MYRKKRPSITSQVLKIGIILIRNMGLLHPEAVAQVTIDFYSDVEVSVTYSCIKPQDQNEEDMRLVYLVAFCYSKSLYLLQNHQGADSLINYIQNIYDGWKEAFRKNPSSAVEKYRPKLPEQYAYLVEKKEGKIIKSFSADLNQSSRGTYSIWMKIPKLEPNRYIPPSVVAFVQYAINNLHEPTQSAFLIITLGAMNHYYEEHGNHTDMGHVQLAPHYGVQGASGLIQGLSRL